MQPSDFNIVQEVIDAPDTPIKDKKKILELLSDIRVLLKEIEKKDKNKNEQQ